MKTTKWLVGLVVCASCLTSYAQERGQRQQADDRQRPRPTFLHSPEKMFSSSEYQQPPRLNSSPEQKATYQEQLEALQQQIEQQSLLLQALQQQLGQEPAPAEAAEEDKARPVSFSVGSARNQSDHCEELPCDPYFDDPSSLFSVTYSGLYAAGAYSQNDFFLGRRPYKDNFVEQLLRLNLNFAAGDYLQAITRFDLSQGWWGVDNALQTRNRPGFAPPRGASQLFDFKDTNYALHVDRAYVQFDFPNAPITGRIGRQWYMVGNRLMVDNNYDGVQFDINQVLGDKITFSWAKVSEGVDSLSDESLVAADSRGFTDARDAHLFIVDISDKLEDYGLTYNVYALNYTDRSIADGNAYIPDQLQFGKTRFSPQITELNAVGVALNYTQDRFSIDGEFDYLVGKDAIANATFDTAVAQMLDKNNGDLRGYNLFLKPSYALIDRVKLGGILGLGSGDSNVAGGRGNVNKLRTSGFFYMTEVWEDSVMPDEEGITPQGLGAPNVRGYRELENTTILQANVTIKPQDNLTLFFSYSYIRATEPVHAWAPGVGDTVVDPTRSSQNLGQEVDFRITYGMYKNLDFIFRGGVFMPGDAAGYLINGTNVFNDNAWELKGHVAAKF